VPLVRIIPVKLYAKMARDVSGISCKRKWEALLAHLHMHA